MYTPRHFAEADLAALDELASGYPFAFPTFREGYEHLLQQA